MEIFLPLTPAEFVGMSIANPRFRVYYYYYDILTERGIKRRFYAIVTKAGSEKKILETDTFNSIYKCKKEIKSILAEL